MDYTFDIFSLFAGLFIILLGIVFIKWYKQISNFFGLGVTGYEKFRLAALIVCIIGILVSINMHIYVLRLIVKILIPQ